MSVEGSLSLLGCIRSVCAAAAAVVSQMGILRNAVIQTQQTVEASGTAIQCVVNGAEGAVCDLPLGGRLPTLATALADLNADQVASLTGDAFTATAGQTDFTLSVTPASALHVEAVLCGAELAYPGDFSLAGDVLSLTAGAEEDDELQVRVLGL